ncbi:hypothetical protein D9M68_413960 [compost metagenome]
MAEDQAQGWPALGRGSGGDEGAGRGGPAQGGRGRGVEAPHRRPPCRRHVEASVREGDVPLPGRQAGGRFRPALRCSLGHRPGAHAQRQDGRHRGPAGAVPGETGENRPQQDLLALRTGEGGGGAPDRPRPGTGRRDPGVRGLRHRGQPAHGYLAHRVHVLRCRQPAAGSRGPAGALPRPAVGVLRRRRLEDGGA